MVVIKRTARGNTPKAAWVADYYGDQYPTADQVHEGDYPSHSLVLGPDGRQLEYEPRQRLGFDLRRRGEGSSG